MAPEDRLLRLLGGEPLARLRLRLRERYARTATAATDFRIAGLTATERDALAALLGRRPRVATSMQVDVAAIDAALREAGLADTLRDALEQLDGPIIDRAAERAARESLWQQVRDACSHETLASLLQSPANLGLLKRLSGQDPAVAAGRIADAEAVLHRLPAQGLTRAQLAASVLGDAHALDSGCAVATLVLAVLRSVGSGSDVLDLQGVERDGPSDRDVWAGAGVLVNELARPALALNLPVNAARGAPWPLGEPAYLSLRRLLRSPPEWAVRGRAVFICENPNLLAIAADQLGARCAPMVCTEGMPAAAQRALLTQLARAGAQLRYHGDFDWPGLRIGNHMMREHGARPWRFGAADYGEALDAAPRPGRPLQGAETEPTWDGGLGAAMRAARQAIDEEMVVEQLLPDLEAGGA